MRTPLSAILVLLKKDLRLIARASQVSGTIAGFAVLAVVIASFAFRESGLGVVELRALSAGVVWLVFLFTATSAFNHSFQPERENRALDVLLGSGVDPLLIYGSKFMANVLFLLAIQSIVLITQTLLFSAGISDVLPELFTLSLVCALGFVAVGTLLGGVAASTTAPDVIMPLLLFPLTLPLFLAAVHLTGDVLATSAIPFGSSWFALAVVYDICAVTICGILFEFVAR